MAEISDINGYSLLRKIGEGGFGKVFLAQKGGEFFAVKILESEKAFREIKALEKYKNLREKNSHSLVEILDSGEVCGRFFCAMPLADPLYPDIPAESPKWREKTLANIIEQKLENPNAQWFSPDEIAEIILPIIDAAVFLNKNGLAHRDIKPSNILFFGGKPALSDFGLLADDRREYSSAVGTPIFSAPLWFLNSGGNSDVYGLVATFYMLVSGNYPDGMGNPNFLMPQSVKNSADSQIKAQYKHWHRVILRALAEDPRERFLTLEDLKAAIVDKNFEASKSWTFSHAPRKSRLKKTAIAAAAALIFALAILAPKIFQKSGSESLLEGSPNASLNAAQKDIESFLEGKDADFIMAFKNGKALPQPYTVMPYEQYAKSALFSSTKNAQQARRKLLESNQLAGEEKEKALRFVKKNSFDLYLDYYNSKILTYEHNCVDEPRRSAEIESLRSKINELKKLERKIDLNSLKKTISELNGTPAPQERGNPKEISRQIEELEMQIANLQDMQNKERKKFLEQLKEYTPQ